MIRRPILALIILLLLAGCDSPPPKDEISADIQQHLRKKRIGHFANPDEYFQLANDVQSYEIVNHYTTTIDDEKWFIYDVKAVVRAVEGPYDVRVRIGFIKRGKEWYFKETEE